MELVGYEDVEARSHEALASLVVHYIPYGNPQAQDNYVIKTLEKIEPNVIKGQASYYVTADNIVGLSGGSSRYVHIANAIKSAYNKTAPKNARIV